MLNENDLDNIVINLPSRSYRYATVRKEVELTPDLKATLGNNKRQAIRIVNIALDVLANKLFVEKIITEDTYAELIRRWLNTNQWETKESDIYRLISRDGAIYLGVTWNDAGYPELGIREAYDGINGAANIVDSLTGKTMYAVNINVVNTVTYLDAYYSDRVERYQRIDNKWSIDDTVEWVDNDKQPLGIGLIRIGTGVSDIADAIQTQTDYNNARIDQIAISRTQGFSREFITTDKPLTDITNQFGQPLINAWGNKVQRTLDRVPGSMLLLPEGANYSQLDASELDTSLMTQFIEELSLLTAIPAYYLFPSGEAPSGRSLIIQEGRLNAKVEKRSVEITPQLIQVFRLMIKLSNTYANTNLDATLPIDITFSSPEIYTKDLIATEQKDRASVVSMLRQANVISVEDALRYMSTGNLPADDKQIREMVNRVNAENSLLEI